MSIEPFPTDIGNPRVIQHAHRADFDPLPHWRRVVVPVFAAWGSQDIRVPARESRDRLAAVLDLATTSFAHELQLYEGSGHGLEDPSTGMLREDFIDDLVRWMGTHFRKAE